MCGVHPLVRRQAGASPETEEAAAGSPARSGACMPRLLLLLLLRAKCRAILLYHYLLLCGPPCYHCRRCRQLAAAHLCCRRLLLRCRLLLPCCLQLLNRPRRRLLHRLLCRLLAHRLPQRWTAVGSAGIARAILEGQAVARSGSSGTVDHRPAAPNCPWEQALQISGEPVKQLLAARGGRVREDVAVGTRGGRGQKGQWSVQGIPASGRRGACCARGGDDDASNLPALHFHTAHPHPWPLHPLVASLQPQLLVAPRRRARRPGPQLLPGVPRVLGGTYRRQRAGQRQGVSVQAGIQVSAIQRLAASWCRVGSSAVAAAPFLAAAAPRRAAWCAATALLAAAAATAAATRGAAAAVTAAATRGAARPRAAQGRAAAARVRASLWPPGLHKLKVGLQGGQHQAAHGGVGLQRRQGGRVQCHIARTHSHAPPLTTNSLLPRHEIPYPKCPLLLSHRLTREVLGP